MKFFFNQKQDYIGLSSFKTNGKKKEEPRKDTKVQTQKTTLTGLLKRV